MPRASSQFHKTLSSCTLQILHLFDTFVDEPEFDLEATSTSFMAAPPGCRIRLGLAAQSSTVLSSVLDPLRPLPRRAGWRSWASVCV